MKPLPCPAPLWPRFSALLDQALALAPEERARWLDALAGDDAALAAPLRSVLDRQQPLSAGAWLEQPPSAAGPAAFRSGELVGPWRLLRPLGSGGMGEVWLAARDDGAYQREVALKLPHAHLLSGALHERFARERNILAGLSHPNIARFYDAGLDGAHRPWLALEYVDGAPITSFCRDHGLSVPARVALLRQVASAVQAAHARLVVHRDLKPANVLVTPAGQVRLLDFGIAKLLDDDAPGDALTELHGRAATPDYAAPEQIGRGEVTVATDVFALGVMLFELLAGVRPWAAESGPGRLLRERGEAPLASSRAQGEARKALRGDLDAILAKALDPVPAARYASMEAFAADLDRYLAHQPVQARRIGRLQRLGKFVRRHRSGVALGAVMALLLVAGVGGVLWQAQVGSSRVDLQACKLEYSIVSPK